MHMCNVILEAKELDKVVVFLTIPKELEKVS